MIARYDNMRVCNSAQPYFAAAGYINSHCQTCYLDVGVALSY